MNQYRLNNLIKALVENHITREEYDELMDYLRTHPDDSQLSEVMEQFTAVADRTNHVDDEARQRLYQQIRQHERFKPNRRMRRIWWSSVAAGILLLIGLGYFINQQGLFISGDQQVFSGIAYTERVISNGTRTKIEFPDGSSVWINSGSILRYPTAYMDSPRELYLEGEAYFDVKPLDGKPFIVHTGEVSTHVLGTSFNIQAYEDKQVDVSVASGIVQVKSNHELLGELKANQRIEYDKGAVRKMDTDVYQYLAWQRGELILDDTDLETAAKILARQYDMEIYFANERIKKCKFTASFLQNEKISQIVKVISQINGLDFKIEGKQITFSGSGC